MSMQQGYEQLDTPVKMRGPAGMVAEDPLDMGRRETKRARRQARRNANGENGDDNARDKARRRRILLAAVSPIGGAHLVLGLAKRAIHAVQKKPQSQQSHQQQPAHHAGASYQ